jgi:hypothetical protein
VSESVSDIEVDAPAATTTAVVVDLQNTAYVDAPAQNTAYVDADTPGDADPTSDPADAPATARRPARRLATYQLDFVAMALTNAVPPDEIAAAVEVDPQYIRYLARRSNERFNKLWDGYRQQLLNETVAWRFKLAKLLPLGYDAIESALNQRKDLKLACEQAWLVMHAVIPQSRPATAAAPAVQLNFGANAQVQALTADTMNGVFASINSLKAALLNGDANGNSYVKQGADAIVQVGIPDTPGDAPLVGERFGNGSGNGGRSNREGPPEPTMPRSTTRGGPPEPNIPSPELNSASVPTVVGGTEPGATRG